MSIPYDVDVMLPAKDRFLSGKFRRVCRKFWPTKMDWDEAAELVALMHVTGAGGAMGIFQWDVPTLLRAKAMGREMASEPDVQMMARENLARANHDDGLRLIQIAKECGWTTGELPIISDLALMDLRAKGMRVAEIARFVGLKPSQVGHRVTVRDRRSFFRDPFA